jgi:hypothetical protein
MSAAKIEADIRATEQLLRQLDSARQCLPTILKSFSVLPPQPLTDQDQAKHRSVVAQGEKSLVDLRQLASEHADVLHATRTSFEASQEDVHPAKRPSVFVKSRSRV